MADMITNFIYMDEENIQKFCELYGVEDEDEADFSFNLIIPQPATEADCPDKYKPAKGCEPNKDKPWFNWYNWNVDHWGVKWDADDSEGS